jgi:hypothetical protein
VDVSAIDVENQFIVRVYVLRDIPKAGIAIRPVPINPLEFHFDLTPLTIRLAQMTSRDLSLCG